MIYQSGCYEKIEMPCQCGCGVSFTIEKPKLCQCSCVEKELQNKLAIAVEALSVIAEPKSIYDGLRAHKKAREALAKIRGEG